MATNTVSEVRSPVVAGITNAPDGVQSRMVLPKPVVAVPKRTTVSSVSTNTPAERQVRLANRTISLEKGRRKFPAKFAELQMPSARGTVTFVVVSELPVSKIVRDRASACGARVLGFMPVNSLIVEASAKTLKRLEDDAFFAAAYELDPKDKVQEHVRDLAAANPERVDVTVLPLMATDVGPLKDFVGEKGGTVIPESGGRGVLRARISASVVDELAKRGDVRWIEHYVPASLQNNVAVKPGLMNVQPVWKTHGLTGRGQFLTCADSGLDSGDPMTVMDDFRGRIVSIRQTSSTTLKKDVFGHGTHVAGSLVGTGERSNGEIRGVAHGARLWVWGSATTSRDLIFPDWTELFQPDTNVCPAFVHSESWGYEDSSFYTVQCQSVDAWLWEHPGHLVVFSAGNKGAAGTISDPSGAKNVLSVGATESLRPGTSYGYHADNVSQIADFSARGPMRDGRIKPDICAPGTMILSTRTREIPSNLTVGWESYAANTNYTYNGGTSMAAPLVAGAAALVREWLVERRGFTNELPTAALMKAILMGGAHDMSADMGADCGGAAPNNRQGWGRIDLGETLYPSNLTVRLFDRVPFSQGSEVVFRVTVTNGAPLDVQLVWLDYPSDPLARQALVNDLDLVVSNETTGAVWWGNGVNGGDRVNTVEGVRIGAAAPATYSVWIKGVTVPYDSTEGGAAALYVRGAFEGMPEMVFAEGPEAEVFPLRYRSRFPSLKDWGTTETTMILSGQVVRVSVPEDLPDGAEHLESMEWEDESTGQKTLLDEQRLAEVVCAARGASEGELVLDASGRMPRSFEVEMDAPVDVLFRYYGVFETNSVAGLPEWWYRRYLAGATEGTEFAKAGADADGDGVSNADEFAADTDPVDPESVFRIVSVSPTNIVWRGGCERTQVVERTESIGASAAWTGIFTNLPPTAREGAFALPAATSNSFYRIRAF
ncbi:MAG: S8 family serine peptidase [bacterium]|nr:S8 family serine peptidase [bacterium]